MVWRKMLSLFRTVVVLSLRLLFCFQLGSGTSSSFPPPVGDVSVSSVEACDFWNKAKDGRDDHSRPHLHGAGGRGSYSYAHDHPSRHDRGGEKRFKLNDTSAVCTGDNIPGACSASCFSASSSLDGDLCRVETPPKELRRSSPTNLELTEGERREAGHDGKSHTRAAASSCACPCPSSGVMSTTARGISSSSSASSSERVNGPVCLQEDGGEEEDLHSGRTAPTAVDLYTAPTRAFQQCVNAPGRRDQGPQECGSSGGSAPVESGGRRGAVVEDAQEDNSMVRGQDEKTTSEGRAGENAGALVLPASSTQGSRGVQDTKHREILKLYVDLLNWQGNQSPAEEGLSSSSSSSVKVLTAYKSMLSQYLGTSSLVPPKSTEP